MFTFEPARTLLPGAGFCEMTTPFFTLAEKAFLTFPTEQCARLIAVLAAASFLPFTFGTTHFFCDGGGGGGGEELAWKVAVAAPAREARAGSRGGGQDDGGAVGEGVRAGAAAVDSGGTARDGAGAASGLAHRQRLRNEREGGGRSVVGAHGQRAGARTGAVAAPAREARAGSHGRGQGDGGAVGEVVRAGAGGGRPRPADGGSRSGGR